MLYAWMQRNDQYYRYCGGETSPGRIRQDLTLCPPGIPLAQKYYVGFFAAGTLVAVMDLVDGYPDADTAFIGFFMMNKSLQGRGVDGSCLGGAGLPDGAGLCRGAAGH